jgi:acyl-coenzyme A thioesterase PaaI-like protein
VTGQWGRADGYNQVQSTWLTLKVAILSLNHRRVPLISCRFVSRIIRSLPLSSSFFDLCHRTNSALPTMSLPPTTFGDASLVESLGQHEYRVTIHPDFSWGTVAHGGYLFSLLSKVIALHYSTTLQKYNQPDTVAMHVELLRPAPLGEAKVVVKDVRLGKGSSTVHVALVQDGKERVAGYAT